MSRGNLVIDGTQLLMANLAVNDDDYTNAEDYLGGMMGLVRQVAGLINMFQPYSVFVAFDIDKSKYRLSLFPEYKAGRHVKISEELQKKFAHRAIHTSYLKLIFPMLGVNVMTCPDVEADDVIANFVRQSKRFNTIVSTDKDFIQLVDPNTRLYRPIRNPVMVTNNNIDEILGFSKDLFLDVKTLEGDKSDNIEGVKGVGAKTALKIFKLAGSNEVPLVRKWAEEECTHKYKDELIKFIDEDRWNFNLKLMDLRKGPEVDIKETFAPLERDYEAAYNFLLELQVDDFIFEDDIHRILTAYDDLK